MARLPRPTPKPDVAVIVAVMLVVTAVTAVRPAASYRALALDASAGVVGLVGASYALLALPLTVAAGRLIDRRGPAMPFLVGCCLVAAGAGTAATAPALGVLVVGLAVVGLGHVTVELAAEALAARMGRGGSSQRWFARMAVGTSGGHMVGPLLGGGLTARGESLLAGTRTVLLAAVLASLLAAGLALRRRAWTATQRPRPRQRHATGREVVDLLRVADVRRALGVSIGVLAGIDLTVVYLPLLGEARSLPTDFVGLLIGLRGGAALLSRMAVAWVLHRRDPRRVLTVSLTLAAFGLVAVPLVDAPVALAGVVVLVGAGLGVGQPLAAAWVADGAPPDRVATALSLRLTGNRASQLVLPAGLGALAAGAGIPAVFVAGAATLGATAVWVGLTPTRPPS